MWSVQPNEVIGGLVDLFERSCQINKHPSLMSLWKYACWYVIYSVDDGSFSYLLFPTPLCLPKHWVVKIRHYALSARYLSNFNAPCKRGLLYDGEQLRKSNLLYCEIFTLATLGVHMLFNLREQFINSVIIKRGVTINPTSTQVNEYPILVLTTTE